MKSGSPHKVVAVKLALPRVTIAVEESLSIVINMTTLPPFPDQYFNLSFATPQILLITLQRGPFNMMNYEMQHALQAALTWYDSTPNLRCAIMTGNGKKGFCAGADLIEWEQTLLHGKHYAAPAGGFGATSRRRGKKPLIAAVNGVCLGGGMEMIINCDLVVASKEHAKFGLPEVKRGVFAKMGALGRIVRFIGLQRASELALLGDNISPETALEWGLVNRVVPHEKLLETAIGLAQKIADNSPDSIIASRSGMLMSLEHGSLERSTQLHNEGPEVHALEIGENIKEGLRSFREKRATKWVDSKI